MKPMKINKPKPGDQLPFVVAEWDIYRAIYNSSGIAAIQEYQEKNQKWAHCQGKIRPILALLGMPYKLEVSATVSEGGEE